MIILTWLLTLLLVVDCLVLMLLVLIQLPKKEAGMGQAFGGSATDALFGPGSGTALTKMTKYAAGFFFGLTLVLAMVHLRAGRSASGDLRGTLDAAAKSSLTPPPKAPPTSAPPAAAAAAAAAPTTVSTGALKLLNITNTTAPTPATKAPAEKTNK